MMSYVDLESTRCGMQTWNIRDVICGLGVYAMSYVDLGVYAISYTNLESTRCRMRTWESTHFRTRTWESTLYIWSSADLVEWGLVRELMKVNMCAKENLHSTQAQMRTL